MTRLGFLPHLQGPGVKPVANTRFRDKLADAKANINAVEIVARYVDLRKVGHRWRGLCPFHAERTPSFFVTEARGYHCFGCGERGDVITFVMKTDGLTFPEACRALGIDGDRKPRPTMTTSRKTAAELAADWCNLQSAKFNAMIADAMALRDDADEAGAFELAETLDRELTMLRGFYESLNYPGGATEILASRAAIENLTNGSKAAL